MWPKTFANYLLRKRINAIWVLLVLCLLPPMIASLASIILGLVTLNKGAKEGFILLLWAVLPFVVQAYVHKVLWLALVPFFGFAGLWLGAIVLRAYGSWTVLLRYFGLLSVLAVVLAHVLHPGLTEFWAAHIFAYMQEMTELVPNATVTKQQAMTIATVATGFQVLLFMVSVSFKLMMARWWQALIFNPGGLRKELYGIRLDNIVIGLFFVLVVAVLLKSVVAVDAIIPLFGVLLAVGLSLLHSTLGRAKYGFGLLVLFYLIAIIFPYILVAPMLAAVVDRWFNFRSRIGIL
jgi:hypothetical protein